MWPADGAGFVRICRRSAVCLLLPLCLLAAVSCGDGASGGKTFGPPEEIEAELVPISEILKINDIVKLEDYIVLQNSGEGADCFYYVYSCPGLEYLYSFARHGRGPEEYLMPALIGRVQGPCHRYDCFLRGLRYGCCAEGQLPYGLAGPIPLFLGNQYGRGFPAARQASGRQERCQGAVECFGCNEGQHRKLLSKVAAQYGEELLYDIRRLSHIRFR